jgi:ABC-type uncharacterized transport system substrate-binding protein
VQQQRNWHQLYLPIIWRKLIAVICGAAFVWSLPASAQQSRSLIGILRNGTAALPRDLDIVRELTRIGYVEGRNVIYAVRAAAGDSSQLPQVARELAATKPDVIVGSGSPAATALFGATRDIPIVMTVVGDPTALGLTDSISRPTHNVTGFTIAGPSLAEKRLELLHDIVPGLHKVAYLWVPGSPLATLLESRVRTAAGVLGVTLVSLPLTSDTDIASAFARTDKEQATAMLVEADPLTLRFNGAIVDECLIRNLPCMDSWPIEVRNGGLISYGPAEIENNAGAANYVDRILKGAKVAELPFEEPTQFKLAINLRAARSIGLVFPPTVLALADEVIE